MRPILVTGTDTGVGKTFLTCALLRALRQRGLQPFPLKLVETGCRDLRAPEDGLALARAAGRESDLDRIAPFRFQLPASPLTATRAASTPLSEGALVTAVEEASSLGDPLVVEGAGGLLVPLTASLSFADLCARHGWGLVVVARDALGTLNHTLLTLEAARHRGIPVLAVVLNATAVPDAVPIDHGRELRLLGGAVPVLGPMTRLEDGDHGAEDQPAVTQLVELLLHPLG